jgi:hypothetical protein
MQGLAKVLLIVSGIIHLLPLSGVLGGAQLARLYGVPIEDPNLLILMRHRAVLFGLLGVLLIAAAWRMELRTAAYVAGLASVLAFIAVAWITPGYNALIQRVVVADWIAAACLVGALLIDVFARRSAAMS